MDRAGPDHSSLRSAAISGGRWGAARSVAFQLAGLFTTATLARILSEEDFGLVAITVIVLTMFDLITRVGLGAAVIRRPRISQRMVSTYFWAALLLGLLAGGLAAGISQPAAQLAGSVAAAPLVAVAALTLPLNLAATIPSGLLRRDLRFRTLAGINITGIIVHGVVAVSLALMGLGALAVVIGQVSRSAVLLVGTFILSRFKPRLIFDRRLLLEDLSFNAGWLTADLVAYGNKNADYWFVGNRFGAGPLGVYYVAYVIPTVLRQRVTAIGHEVLYPLIAKIQSDRGRVVAAYLSVLRLVAFIVVPTMLGLAMVADLAIAIGFGADWLHATAPLRIIAIGAAITSMSVVAHPVFPAIGRPGVLVVTGLISLAALGIGLSFSIDGGSLAAVAWAVLAAAIVDASVVLTRVRSILGCGFRQFATSVGPYVVSSVLMVCGVWLLRTYAIGEMATVPQALISISTGVFTYLLVGRLLFWNSFRSQFSSVRSLLWR